MKYLLEDYQCFTDHEFMIEATRQWLLDEKIIANLLERIERDRIALLYLKPACLRAYLELISDMNRKIKFLETLLLCKKIYIPSPIMELKRRMGIRR